MRDGTLKSDDNAKIRWSAPKPDGMTCQSPMVLIFLILAQILFPLCI